MSSSEHRPLQCRIIMSNRLTLDYHSFSHTVVMNVAWFAGPFHKFYTWRFVSLSYIPQSQFVTMLLNNYGP